MEDDDLRDLFAGLGPIGIRRLFGGKGIYFQGEIIGVDMGDAVFVKGDAQVEPVYEAAGATRWIYEGRKGPVRMAYWCVPVDVMEDHDEMARWARLAHEVALRARRRRAPVPAARGAIRFALVKKGRLAMTLNFLTISTHGVPPAEDGPAPDRVVAGNPRFRTWNVEERDGLYAGIWEATPGKWRVVYDEWEFCHILSGVSVIAEEGGETRTVRAGDSFVMRPGFRGTWEVLETTRKEYVIRL